MKNFEYERKKKNIKISEKYPLKNLKPDVDHI